MKVAKLAKVGEFTWSERVTAGFWISSHYASRLKALRKLSVVTWPPDSPFCGDIDTPEIEERDDWFCSPLLPKYEEVSLDQVLKLKYIFRGSAEDLRCNLKHA